MKILDDKGFVDYVNVLSYNAIFNFFDTVRNTGKTTKAKYWILARFLKKGKKTLWIRTFETDIKEIKHDFFTERNCKIFKMLNKAGYDIKAENIVVEGEYIYYVDPKTKKRDWFVHLLYLSQAQSIKGNEIPNCDLIVYDEYRTKANRINRYNGNQAKDFIDIVYSIARDHYVRAILLGNKETFNNPFYDYLRIKAPDESFEGVRTYKGGSILVCQVNTVPKQIEQNSMNTRLKKALADTPILSYLYSGKTEGIERNQIVKMPPTTYYYSGFNVGGGEFCARVSNDGKVYFQSGLDRQQHVYSDKFVDQYKYSERLMSGDRKHFKILMNAFKYNKVYYCDVSVYERAQELFKILNT